MIQVLICDDEPTFTDMLAHRLSSILRGIPQKVNLHTICDPHLLTNQEMAEADIAFLDMDMGDTNGLVLAKKFRSIRKDTVLIFVTNYMEYAAEGYEVAAFRYLSKDELDQKLPDYFLQALQVCRKERECISILCQKEEVVVLLNQLIYAETNQRDLLLHLCNSSRKELLTHMAMNALEAKLAGRGFLRIHQSYLVNMAFIQKLQSTATWLDGNIKLPTSARNYIMLKRTYLAWKGQTRWDMP
ncbi:MAG: LytTR family DNA-binding domain-containing protein [Pygmaiobacter sp.]|nr:LytTR family DNA-binding domain-containing protein [Pygmaiobacter sp.]